jgi:hypothetical protein
MAVNTGAELQNKGRELLRHFQTQGTPIMIGMCYSVTKSYPARGI